MHGVRAGLPLLLLPLLAMAMVPFTVPQRSRGPITNRRHSKSAQMTLVPEFLPGVCELPAGFGETRTSSSCVQTVIYGSLFCGPAVFCVVFGLRALHVWLPSCLHVCTRVCVCASVSFSFAGFIKIIEIKTPLSSKCF